MLFKKELEGREIIDRDGTTIGVVEDLELSRTGKIERIVVLPKGLISRMKKERVEINFEDVQAFSNVVLLKKSKEELRGEYKCKKCGQVFSSKKGLKIHEAKEHQKK